MVSVIHRRVSEWSNRCRWRINDKWSTNADREPPVGVGRQCDGYLPFSHAHAIRFMGWLLCSS